MSSETELTLTAEEAALTPRPRDDVRTSAAFGLSLTVLLAVFLCAPLFATAYNLANGVGTVREEGRAPAPRFPTDLASLLRLPGVAKWYFMERYGLKNTLRSLHGLVNVKLLGTSSSSAVVLGRDGWLFLASDRILDYQRGVDRFSDEELTDWVQKLKGRKAWLAKHNAEYAFVVGPNTHTIYPEHLPENLARPGRTRLDQLVEATARTAPEVRLIDLRPTLMSHKAEAPLYFKTDTHWNAIAGWFAAREIARQLGRPLPHGELLPLRDRLIHGGDLARLLGLQMSYVENEAWPADAPLALTTEDGRPLTVTLTDVLVEDRIVVKNPRGKGKALIFRDSFAEALIPWLSAAFETTIWVRSYEFSEDLVARERPNVVIEQVVERKLQHMKAPGAGVSE